MIALDRLYRRLTAAIPEWPLALLMRVGVAAPFFLSGRTKVEGLLTLTPSTEYLFAEEYRVPLLPPATACRRRRNRPPARPSWNGPLL